MACACANMTRDEPIDPAWLAWLEAISDPHSRLEVILCASTRWGAGHQIRSRRLLDHLIYQVVEHDIHAAFAGSERIVEAGQLLWVPPQVEHSFRPAVAGTGVLLYQQRFQLAPYCPPSPPVVLPPDPHRQERLSVLCEGGHVDHPLWPVRYRASLVMVFCDIAQILGMQRRQTASTLTPGQREEIIQAVGEDFWCDPKRLAALLGYHPAYFSRLFKRSFGLAPRSWVLHQRMARAASLLLESGDLVSEVAAKLGYADAFVFSRQFKQVLGVSPRVWRRQHAPPRG